MVAFVASLQLMWIARVEACGYYPIVFGVFVFGSFDMGVPKQSSEVCSEGSVYDCKRHLGKFAIN